MIDRMSLARHPPGQTVVAEERWRELLWSAVPQRVVESSPDVLVTWIPVGAISTVATNRDLPEAVGLSREQRKLLALHTCAAEVAEVREQPTKLLIYRAGRWSRTSLGWDEAGRFLGWYVNFERPPVATDAGLVSKDLVLDLYVEADRSWRWKDREDFELAIDQGVLDESLRATLMAEAERVIDEVSKRSGPFVDRWLDFRPDPSWPVPVLPPDYGWGGRQWQLPRGRRRAP